MSYLWRLRPYFRQVAGLLVIGSIGGVIMNTAIVLPAVLLGHAVDVVVAFRAHEASTADLLLAVLALVAGTAATELPRIGKRYWLGVARTRVRANLRIDCLRGVLAWPPERLGSIAVGDLMSRIVGDVDVIGTGVGEVMVETWDTVLFSISLIVGMFAYDWHLAALALSPVPIALLIALIAGRAVASRMLGARRSAAALTRLLHEQIGGMRLLRLYGRAQAAAGRVSSLAADRAAAELRVVWLEEALGGLYSFLLVAGVVFIIAVGGSDALAGRITVGGLIAFLQLFVRFTTRAPRLPQMVNRVQAGGAAYDRVAPLLAKPMPMAGEPPRSTFHPTLVSGSSKPGTSVGSQRVVSPSAVSLRGVDFTYPGSQQPVLSDISLEIAPGMLVAITGPVGSGKSTLARLVAGILVPSRGDVLIDGHSASSIPPEQRASAVGYLEQDPRLFSGSVADNVAMWHPIDGKAIGSAVSLAALDRDLEAMPKGLATQIGEQGIQISGGQRLRVALARALVSGGAAPGVLVLDDPFSAVDVETEAAIIDSLHRTLAGRSTVLLFSHRLAAFSRADLVVVLRGGRIEESGTHADLVAAGGLYARILHAQTGLRRVS